MKARWERSRFADDLLVCQNFGIIGSNAAHKVPAELAMQRAAWANGLDTIRTCPILVADDPVSRFFMDPGANAEDVERITPVRPPFDRLWIEWEEPRCINIDGKITGTSNFARRTGVVIEQFPSGTRYVAAEAGSIALTLTFFADQYEHGSFSAPILVGRCHFRLDPDGRIASLDGGDGWCAFEAVSTMQGRPTTRPFTDVACRSVFYTLALLNCKNVQLVDGPAPPRLLPKHRKKAGIPFVKYQVLDLDVGSLKKRRADAAPEGEEDPEKRRLHWCRGHFATYTPEKPLFGRLVGTYWVPAHLRGDLDEGAIVSDYRMRA